MGQTNSTFTTANAFPNDVHLEVKQFGPGGTSYEQVTTLAKREVCTIQAPKEKRDEDISVILTFMDSDHSHILGRYKIEKNVETFSCWILSRDGKPIKASANDPWIGLEDNKNYLDDTCPTCTELNQICQICFIQLKMSSVGNSLRVITKFTPEKSLLQYIAELKTRHDLAAVNQVQTMIEDITAVAMKYSALEIQTRVIVGKIQVYAENWKESAEDFLEDGIWEDFLNDIFNIKDIIRELGRATEENGQIRDQVTIIKNRADKEATEFEDKKIEAEKRIEQFETIAYCPETLQVVGGCLLAVLNPMPVAIATVAKMAVFYSAEIYRISKALEATAYKQLNDEAKHIFEQMNLVENHLKVIVDCLEDINKRLYRSTSANDKFLKVLDEKKKEKMAKRALEKAEELIEACLTYLNMTGKKNFLPQIQKH